MAEELGVPMEPAAISSSTVAWVAAGSAQALPPVDGAVDGGRVTGVTVVVPIRPVAG